MSYCSFSSMNWRCDVYVYEDTTGSWTTHVAGRRRAVPPLPTFMDSRMTLSLYKWSGCRWVDGQAFVYGSKLKERTLAAWFVFVAWWHRVVHMGSLRLIPTRRIGLPFDGETFTDPTPEDCADRLQWLSDLGYRVPPSAIEALRKEALRCG